MRSEGSSFQRRYIALDADPVGAAVRSVVRSAELQAELDRPELEQARARVAELEAVQAQLFALLGSESSTQLVEDLAALVASDEAAAQERERLRRSERDLAEKVDAERERVRAVEQDAQRLRHEIHDLRQAGSTHAAELEAVEGKLVLEQEKNRARTMEVDELRSVVGGLRVELDALDASRAQHRGVVEQLQHQVAYLQGLLHTLGAATHRVVLEPEAGARERVLADVVLALTRPLA